jgi:hypothetical protein
VQCNPLWPHVRDTLIPHPRVGQGALDDPVTCPPPVPLAAARGQLAFVTREPQGQQVASTSARPLLLFPIAEPYPPPQPLVHLDPLCIAATVAKVVEPSSDVPLQGLEAGVHPPPVAPCGDLADALFEPLERGIGPTQLAASQLKAEARACAQARGLALGPVDPQS